MQTLKAMIDELYASFAAFRQAIEDAWAKLKRDIQEK